MVFPDGKGYANKKRLFRVPVVCDNLIPQLSGNKLKSIN